MNKKLKPKTQQVNSKQPKSQNKTFLSWYCNKCSKDCYQVRGECRCICGHRLREHQEGNGTKGWKCKIRNCKCKKFYYIVAEGAWIIRCRCKHKHTDHNIEPPYKCQKIGCKLCKGFDSPFVCNCDHGWADHYLKFTEKQAVNPILTMGIIQDHDVGDPTQIQRGREITVEKL